MKVNCCPQRGVWLRWDFATNHSACGGTGQRRGSQGEVAGQGRSPTASPVSAPLDGCRWLLGTQPPWLVPGRSQAPEQEGEGWASVSPSERYGTRHRGPWCPPAQHPCAGKPRPPSCLPSIPAGRVASYRLFSPFLTKGKLLVRRFVLLTVLAHNSPPDGGDTSARGHAVGGGRSGTQPGASGQQRPPSREATGRWTGSDGTGCPDLSFLNAEYLNHR